MTTELHWLTLTLLMTALYWIPYILDRLAVRGVVPALTDSKPETGGPHSLWAQRAIKAHANAVENLMIFAPAVLILHALSISTPVTRAAVVVFFAARLVHFLVYLFGVPLLRTIAFFVGWAAQIALLATLLRWI